MQTKKIRIKKETYDKLTKKGKFGDTIDDIINRILDGIEIEDRKTTQMTNSIMNLKNTKQHERNPLKLN
jgi:predicted CopG family antitoxin